MNTQLWMISIGGGAGTRYFVKIELWVESSLSVVLIFVSLSAQQSLCCYLFVCSICLAITRISPFIWCAFDFVVFINDASFYMRTPSVAYETASI